jgi:hypothetical protein
MDAFATSQLEQLALDLQRRLGGRVRNLRLLVRGTGLVLLGQADTHHAKQLVQHAVMEEISLPLLANQMEVIGRN